MGYDITSFSNPQVKRLIRLRQRRHRDSESVFLVEGRRLYDRALAAGLTPEATYTDGSVGELAGPLTTVAPDVLDRVSYRTHSEGVIAIFPQFDTSLDDVHLSACPLILVADGVEKPGNLGAMIRTAVATEVDLLASATTVDTHNPNLLRASTGALFDVPVVIADLAHLSNWMAERDVPLLAATPDADVSLWDVDLTGPSAILVGAEDTGISPEARRLATTSFRIPHDSGAVDSLNTSVATAVALFEARRQRQLHGIA